MKLSKSKFRHILLKAIHLATKGKQADDLELIAGELEKEANALRMILSKRKSNETV